MEASDAASRKGGRAPITALFAIGGLAFLLSSTSSADPTSSLVRRGLSEDGTVTESTASAQDGGVLDTSTNAKNFGPSYASQLLEPIDYYELCFVKSVFSRSENFEEADEVPPISSEFIQNYPQVGFFLFTNITSPDYAQGWNKLHSPHVSSSYSRTITQSRYGKFLAWQQPEIGKTGKCRAVVYTDGFHAIRELAAPGDNTGDTIFKSLHSSISTEKPTLEKWIEIANKVVNNPAGPGIMQQKHFMTREKLGGPHAAPYWWIGETLVVKKRENNAIFGAFVWHALLILLDLPTLITRDFRVTLTIFIKFVHFSSASFSIYAYLYLTLTIHFLAILFRFR